MANEFIIKNGFFSQGNSNITGSLNVTAGITGSFSGNGSGLTGVGGVTVGTTAVTSGTNGRVFFQAGGVVQQDANFTFDNALKRLTLKAVNTAATDIPFAVQNSAGSSNLFSIRGDQAIEMIASTPSTNGGILITKTDNYNSPRIQLYNVFSQLTDINGSSITTSNFKCGNSGASGYMGIVNPSSQDRFLKFINLFGNETLSIGGNNYDGAATFTMKSWAGTSPGNIFTIIKSDNTNPFVITDAARVGIGTNSPQSRLDVRAQGALSTDIAFRVRNSADTVDLFSVRGNGEMYIPQAPSNNQNVIYFAGTTDSIIRYSPSGIGSIAFGQAASITNATYYNTVIGNSSSTGASAGFGIAIGFNTLVNSTGGIAIGDRAKTTGNDTIVIGNTGGNTTYSGTRSIYLGKKGNNGNNIISDDVFMTHFNSDNSSTLIRANGSLGLLGQQAYILQNGTGIYGTDTFMGNGGNTFIVRNHPSVPSLNITDSFQQYSADITAGNAAPHFRTEVGDIIKLYKQSSAGITTVADLVTVLTNLGLLG